MKATLVQKQNVTLRNKSFEVTIIIENLKRTQYDIARDRLFKTKIFRYRGAR